MCCPMSVCKIAGRLRSVGLSSCCCSAQFWQRCSSFLCPSTMSVRCTVAGAEHDWHFMASTLLEFSNPVAKAGRFFVGFLGHRLLQLLPELIQFRLGLLVLRQAARR